MKISELSPGHVGFTIGAGGLSVLAIVAFHTLGFYLMMGGGALGGVAFGVSKLAGRFKPMETKKLYQGERDPLYSEEGWEYLKRLEKATQNGVLFSDEL